LLLTSARSSARRDTRRGDLTQRASLTAIASLLDYGSKLAVGVLLTPLLVGSLGKSLFGTWEVLVRLVGYLSMADGRPMDALRLVLGSRHESVDEETNRRTIGMAVGVWILCLPLMALGGAAIVWSAPLFVQAPAGLVLAVRVVSGLLVLNTVLLMTNALPEAVLFGVNQGYRRMGLVAATNVLGALLAAGAVSLGWGLTGLATAQLTVTFITGATFLALARRYVPWFGVARPAVAEMRWFARLSGWSFAGDSLARLLLAGDVVILGMLASTTTVTGYVLTGYAAQAIVGVLTLALGAVVPGLAGVIGRQQFPQAAAIRAEMLSISWVAATAVGATILAWNEAFLQLWVGPGHYAGALSNLLLVLVMVQTTLIRSEAYVINSALQLRARVLVSIPAAVLTCGLAVWLVPRYTIPGLCLSLLAGRLVQSIAYPVLVQSAIGGTASSNWASLTRAALMTALLFLVSTVLGQRVVAANWVAWAFGAGASFLSALVIALYGGLAPENRQQIVARLRVVLEQRITATI